MTTSHHRIIYTNKRSSQAAVKAPPGARLALVLGAPAPAAVDDALVAGPEGPPADLAPVPVTNLGGEKVPGTRLGVQGSLFGRRRRTRPTTAASRAAAAAAAEGAALEKAHSAANVSPGSLLLGAAGAAGGHVEVSARLRLVGQRWPRGHRVGVVVGWDGVGAGRGDIGGRRARRDERGVGGQAPLLVLVRRRGHGGGRGRRSRRRLRVGGWDGRRVRGRGRTQRNYVGVAVQVRGRRVVRDLGQHLVEDVPGYGGWMIGGSDARPPEVVAVPTRGQWCVLRRGDELFKLLFLLAIGG